MSLLTGHWKMNDNTDNKIIVDSLGGYNLELNSRNTIDMSVSGKINTALNFNGSDSAVVYVGEDSSWAAPTAISSGYLCLDNYLGGLEGTTLLLINTWYNVITTYVASTHTMTWYLNNTYENSGVVSSAYGSIDRSWSCWFYSIINPSNYYSTLVCGKGYIFAVFRIGYWMDDYFVGKVEDIRLYNFVLSSFQRGFIYNNGIGTEAELPSIGTTYPMPCYL